MSVPRTPNIYAYIKNAELMIRFFETWPTFHDAEVLKLRLDRKGVFLELDIYVFSGSRDTDRKGFYRHFKECLLTLRFHEIDEMQLEGFNQQNVLASLTVDKGERFEVELEPIFGLGGTFSCSAIEVVSAQAMAQAME